MSGGLGPQCPAQQHSRALHRGRQSAFSLLPEPDPPAAPGSGRVPALPAPCSATRPMPALLCPDSVPHSLVLVLVQGTPCPISQQFSFSSAAWELAWNNQHQELNWDKPLFGWDSGPLSVLCQQRQHRGSSSLSVCGNEQRCSACAAVGPGHCALYRGLPGVPASAGRSSGRDFGSGEAQRRRPGPVLFSAPACEAVSRAGRPRHGRSRL